MMIDLAWISLAALVLVIVLSCTTAVNPGFVSLALAWVIGIYLAPLWGRHFTVGEIMAGFPTDLFLTLVGVTLLFTLARDNGTLDQVVRTALRGCRGNAGLIPIVFFGLSLEHRVDRSGKHRGRRIDRAPGDGGRGPGQDLPVPDDAHGGARLHCRGPFADRPDGDHRQWLDGPDGDVGIRAAELPV